MGVVSGRAVRWIGLWLLPCLGCGEVLGLRVGFAAGLGLGASWVFDFGLGILICGW